MRRTAVVVLVVLLAPVARADREAAAFFAGRGERALEDKDYGEAETQFHRALAEQANYLRAILGLAMTAKGMEKIPDAVGYLETCMDIAESRELDKAEQEFAERAESMLKELDRARLDYRRIERPYVRKLLALAERSKESDAELARRCAERILKLDPEHARARKILEEVGPRLKTREETPFADPNEIALFNGENLQNWADTGGVWSVTDGKIVGTVKEHAYVMRTKEMIEGDYRLEIEARILSDSTDTPRICVMFGVKQEDDAFELNVFKTSFSLAGGTTAEDKKKLHGVDHFIVDDAYDRHNWNRYTIEVKGNHTKLSVNGLKFAEHRVPESVEYDGYVALVVQECVAEFRKVAVVK
jgi:tetratricopeptide (TPR) repeat protein